MRRLLIASIFLGATATMANAAPQSLPAAGALDKLPVEYTRHNRDHRMSEMQYHQDRHRYYRRDRYRDGYGYGHRRGGPPPWAPAHGYRRHYSERW